ncbi:hypothetical protein E2562_030830 [Oryza meyeriana var. granulata]|uniref:Uncharacterized protein n=1 Tax=Oryza meyeriana var. granulata TaxID=110450 RepID=A0A6G1E4E1_9ORYZ|nr:hypothetical protein E2562_030830 [Oryza meyeriana var. granulata]
MKRWPGHVQWNDGRREGSLPRHAKGIDWRVDEPEGNAWSTERTARALLMDPGGERPSSQQRLYGRRRGNASMAAACPSSHCRPVGRRERRLQPDGDAASQALLGRP